MIQIAWLLSVGGLAIPSLAAPVAAPQSYQLIETWQGNAFIDYFDFHSGSDPTHGFVQYVDQQTAENTGMVKVNADGSVYLGVDYTTTLSPSAAGRSSIRVGSKKYYDEGLYIADIAHMPGSICGIWPAFWTTGQNWPHGGEIDIIEGVNQEQENGVVIHTGGPPGQCALSPSDGFTGRMQNQECSEQASSAGCFVHAGPGSYGDPFNAAHGGIYAMERTSTSIKIWFFPRAAIPSSIANGTPDIGDFGAPVSALGAACDVQASFQSQQFIFDTTFCGDWAGGIYLASQCPKSNPQSGLQSCVDFVANNPAAFQEAYWQINSIKVYQYRASQVSAVPNVPAPPATTAAAATSVPLTTYQTTASPLSSSAVLPTTPPAGIPSTSLATASDHPTTSHSGSSEQYTSNQNTEITSLSASAVQSTASIQPQAGESTSALVSSAAVSSASTSTLPGNTTVVTHVTPLVNSQGITYMTISRTETTTICAITQASSTMSPTPNAQTSSSHGSLTSPTPSRTQTRTITHSTAVAHSNGLSYTTLYRTETTTICFLTETSLAVTAAQTSPNPSIAATPTVSLQSPSSTSSVSTPRSTSVAALSSVAGAGSGQPTIPSIPSTTVRPSSPAKSDSFLSASGVSTLVPTGSPPSSSSSFPSNESTRAQPPSAIVTGLPTGAGLAGALFTGAARKLSMSRPVFWASFVIALLA